MNLRHLPLLTALCAVPASAATPNTLTAHDWSSIRAAYEAGRHRIAPAGVGFRAENPGQAWTTRFDDKGFFIQPQDAKSPWKWGLRLTGYGFGNCIRNVSGRPAATPAGSRLSYAWDGTMREWFINDGRGLEHGFTLAKRPAGSRAATPLTLTLAVRGNLRPKVNAGGQGVQFTDARGASVLNYAGLKVFDAGGKLLPARFATAAPGSALRLTVDERGARYPITIDPVVQQTYLKASNTGANDGFGQSVAISGNTVVVGARGEDSAANTINGDGTDDTAGQAGAAYVFVKTGGAWTQQAYLKAANARAASFFGDSVAISGDTIAVGASQESSGSDVINSGGSDTSAAGAGAVYVFTRTGSTWTQQAYLKASNSEADDRLGESVAISGDTVVAGAFGEDSAATGVNGNAANNAASRSGAAYVFARSGSTWTQQAYLKASNAQTFDEFGTSVSVSGDTVVVGASGEAANTKGVNGSQTDNNMAGAGAAYVFKRTGAVWAQQAYLKASNTFVNAYFGAAVAVSGETVLVGSYGEASRGAGVGGVQNDSGAAGAGAAYVFTRAANVWTQQVYIKPTNPRANNFFGYSVALDGDLAIVGSIQESSNATGVDGDQDDLSLPSAGAAYLFRRDNDGAWSQQAYLKAPNPDTADYFGQSVALSGDTAVIGAVNESSSATGVNGNGALDDATAAGAAYLFEGLGAPEISVEQPVDTGLQDGASTIAFGNGDLATGGETKTFTVKNSGLGDLAFTSIQLLPADGTAANDFVLRTNNFTNPIRSGKSTEFTVAFTPHTAGPKQVTLSLANNDADESLFTVTLTGTGVENPSLVVTTLADVTAVDGQTSLREAIAYANSDFDSSIITFAPGLTGTIQLTGTLSLATNIEVRGPGANELTLRRDTGGDYPVVAIGQMEGHFSDAVTISGLTITNGRAPANPPFGGGIYNGGTLTIKACAIVDNTATYGAGIQNYGGLVVENSTISGNHGIAGSAVNNPSGFATLRNTTVSGNTFPAGTTGGLGAIEMSLASEVTLQNCTVVGNDMPGVQMEAHATKLTVRNSIIAGNLRNDIVRSANTVVNDGYNIIGNNLSVEASFPAGSPSGTSFAGTAAAPLNPQLGPLAFNGGPTQTHAVLNGSPAYNAGDLTVEASDTSFDQRGPGFPRVIAGRLDIGAYEAVTEQKLSVSVTPGFPAAFNESDANPVTKVRVTRTGPTTEAALVTLSTASPRIKLPAKVSIPAGESFVDVPVTAVDDDFVDGPTDAVILVSSPGYLYLLDPSGTLHITDDDGTAPDLLANLAPLVFAENKTGTLQLTIQHNRALLSEVPVTLTSLDTRLHWPAVVKFPAGSRKITVPLTVTADPGNRGTVVSKINITASGFVGASVSPTIYDVQSALGLAVAPGSPASFSEGAGSGATLIRVSRNTPITASVVVDLSVRTGAGRIAVPARVTIPVGQEFVDVAVRAIENTVYENNQRVQIAATAVGYTAAPLVALTVTENDPPPALTASLNPASFYENRATTIPLTVTHNRESTETAVPLTLKTADTRLSWPAGLTIPAGSRSVVVPLTVTPTLTIEGTVKTEIVVSAPAFTATKQAVATIWDVQSAITAAIAPGFSATFSEGAGQTATKIRITRNTPLANSVLVSLTVKRGAGQVEIPASVTIPAGKAFIDLPVAAVDDSVVDGSQPVIVSILGERYPVGATVNLTVLDNDPAAPALALPASPIVLSSASAKASTGTISLTFTGPLSAGAGDPANYGVTVNGTAVPLVRAARKGATVELTLEELAPGAAVAVNYNLTDTSGGSVRGTARVVAQ